MKTNKTPMQEFKCLFIEQFSPLAKSLESVTFSYEYLNILDLVNESLEKEKQFAFDFYTQGQCDWDNPDDNSFEKFYSQYVERKSK